MRYLYDSTSSADIPTFAQMVAGYVDGIQPWTDADWALHPAAVWVRIAVYAGTNDGHVLDVEPGNASPSEAPGWVRMRRAAGVEPTVYCDESTWPAVRAAFAAAGVAEPSYWIAAWNGDASVYAGQVAHQYADSSMTGYHADLSAVLDYWPGVDALPNPEPVGNPSTTGLDGLRAAWGTLVNDLSFAGQRVAGDVSLVAGYLRDQF